MKIPCQPDSGILTHDKRNYLDMNVLGGEIGVLNIEEGVFDNQYNKQELKRRTNCLSYCHTMTNYVEGMLSATC